MNSCTVWISMSHDGTVGRGTAYQSAGLRFYPQCFYCISCLAHSWHQRVKLVPVGGKTWPPTSLCANSLENSGTLTSPPQCLFLRIGQTLTNFNNYIWMHHITWYVPHMLECGVRNDIRNHQNFHSRWIFLHQNSTNSYFTDDITINLILIFFIVLPTCVKIL